MEEPRVVPPHWLRRNEGARSPHRVMFLDAETRPQLVGAQEQHRLRWWHARLVRRHVARPRTAVTVDVAGDQAAELARVVDELAIAKHSLWLYTHNLGFDLTVTQLPELLGGYGWGIVDLGITGRSPWIRMSHGRRRLVLADSTSWLPGPLETIGADMGAVKPVIEDWHNATDEEVVIRCAADVEILTTAMLSVMDWWDENEMGRWQWTGPGCGWAAFRHVFLSSRVLMDPEPERMALERRSIYGGRREAYRIGRQPEGNYADLDFEGAYPAIASYLPLPRRPIARVPYMTGPAYKSLPDGLDVLSECTVTTDVPCVPCRVDGHTLYPVGTFRTVLAGPDIRGVIECGGSVKLGDTILYQTEPFMQEWGRWIIANVYGDNADIPPPVRMWLKHTGRTVIGRWAMHAQRTEDWGEACWPSWHAEPGTDWDTGYEMVDLHVCGRHLRVFRDAEPENVFPAVTAWIEAECRQLLRKAMSACPAGSAIQCDTDGFMLDLSAPYAPAAAARSRVPDGGEDHVLAAAAASPVPERVGQLRVRVKGLYTSAHLLGPQQLLMGESRRISGVPKAFTTVDGLEYTGWTWPGYTWQLAKSQPGVYTRPHVTISLRGPYGSRWLLRNGHTMTPQVMVRDGTNIVLPPGNEMDLVGRMELAETQPAILARYSA